MKFRLETAILDNILFESQSNLNFVSPAIFLDNSTGTGGWILISVRLWNFKDGGS